MTRAAKQPKPEKQPVKPKGGGTYLPTLPKGWVYQVTIQGPGGVVVTLTDGDGEARIRFGHRSGARETVAANLAGAAKAAVTGIRALVKAEEREEALRRERAEALTLFGEVEATPDAAKPVD